MEFVKSFIYGLFIILLFLFLLGTCFRVLNGEVP